MILCSNTTCYTSVNNKLYTVDAPHSGGFFLFLRKIFLLSEVVYKGIQRCVLRLDMCVESYRCMSVSCAYRVR